MTSLTAKLRTGLAALEQGDSATACTSMQDLVNQAEAQRGKKLTDGDATAIVDSATRVRNVLGC